MRPKGRRRKAKDQARPRHGRRPPEKGEWFTTAGYQVNPIVLAVVTPENSTNTVSGARAKSEIRES